MKSSPVKGTRDYLPQEVELRDDLQQIILKTYQDAGFSRISTPILEDAVNLDKSDGGENLNLIFHVLKRGQKLDAAMQNPEACEKDLSDIGLRYDLTLPLSRYYSQHRSELMSPFKVIQMDRVYRAERPQKGRLREFTQCDIDIIGNAESDAEIDLILTTTLALDRVGIHDYQVKINDRRILKAIFHYAGFGEEDYDKLSIIFDKLDKIGMDGVIAEFQAEHFDTDAIQKFQDLFANGSLTLEKVASICDAEYVQNLQNIIQTVNAVSMQAFPIIFSPSLVRGQGYYTGTIFEVEALGYHGAVAGGGRYDHLIGKFTGEDIPAVGFSIGFERIFGILSESGHLPVEKKKRIALFYLPEQYTDALIQARTLRDEYIVSVISRPKKLGKYLNKIEAQHFDGFLVFGEADGIKLF